MNIYEFFLRKETARPGCRIRSYQNNEQKKRNNNKNDKTRLNH